MQGALPDCLLAETESFVAYRVLFCSACTGLEHTCCVGHSRSITPTTTTSKSLTSKSPVVSQAFIEQICIIMSAAIYAGLNRLFVFRAPDLSLSFLSLAQTVEAKQPLASAVSRSGPGHVEAVTNHVPGTDWSSNLSHYESAVSVAAVCDGNKYGRDVISSSCIDALEIIPDLERTVSFGPRHQGTSMLGSSFSWCSLSTGLNQSCSRPALQILEFGRLLCYRHYC